MASVRPKRASVEQMTQLLRESGWSPAGATAEGASLFNKGEAGSITVDNNGWTLTDPEGRDVDFGSNERDLAALLRVPLKKQVPSFDEIHYIHYMPGEDEPDTVGGYFSVVLFNNGEGVWSQLVNEDKLDDVVGKNTANLMRQGEGQEVKQPNVIGETQPWKSLTVHRPKEWVKDITTDPSYQYTDEEKKWLKDMGIKANRKKAVGLSNVGQPGAVCPNCRQPIQEGQMVTYQAGGMEAHAPGQCPVGAQAQPGQQTGWQSRLNLPPGYKQPQVSPSAGRPTASLLKKGDTRFLDDEWRAILEEHGFHPEASPDREVWRNPYLDFRVAIDHDDKGDAFWVAIGPDGKPMESGQDSGRLADQLRSMEPHEEIEWKGDVPQFSEEDMRFMKDFKIQGKLIAKVVNKKKMAGKPPRFSFAVPLKAAGAVAFHLAKADMKDFEVINFADDETSIFAFTNEPEMHVAEEIVKAEFAEQIAGRKGMWGTWAPEPKDITALPEAEPERQHLMSSEKTADEDDIYRELEEEGRQDRELHEEEQFYRGKKFRGPQLVKTRYEHALETALDALDTLAEVGPSVDIKECARMSAGDLRQFAKDQAQGKLSSKIGGAWGDSSADNDTVLDMIPIDEEGIIDAEAALRNIENLSDDPESWDIYLGVVLKIIEMNGDVPPLYRERAKNIALALAGDADYLAEWQNPQSRHAELEREIDILSRGAKTADLLLPDDLKHLNLPEPQGPGMTDEEVRKMEKYRRKKLISWLNEMGFLDDQGHGELLAEYDAGDFWKKDQLYEEARDMIRDHRRQETYYRRTMRGPRPYSRKPKV